MSFYLPLTAISYKRHVTGSRKKEIKSSVIVARCTPSRRNISCCQLPQYKEKGNECRTKSTTKFTRGGTQSKTIEERLCTPSFGGGLHQRFTFSQQCTFSSPSQHSLRILSSLLPFTRNLPITRRPNSCTVLWQQLICWLVLLPSLSMLLIGCPWLGNTGAFDDTHLTQPKSQALHCF